MNQDIKNLPFDIKTDTPISKVYILLNGILFLNTLEQSAQSISSYMWLQLKNSYYVDQR